MLRRSTAPSVEDVLYELESALTDPEVRPSRDRVEQLLHPDFLEIGSSGEVYDRERMIDLMVAETPGDVIIRDFSATEICLDAVLVKYRSVGMSGQEVRRTSLWVNVDGRWLMHHHQGTKVPDHWNRRFRSRG